MEFKQGCEMTGAACKTAQALLSDYIDNALSARQTWDVEKHLSACPDCAAQLQQMQITVETLRSTPRYDTADNFMAKLHARLDGLEPEMARTPALSTRLRDWVAGVQETLRRRSAPALGMALAVSCAAALLIVPQLSDNGAKPAIMQQEAVKSIVQPMQAELDRHVADVANDPLGDVAAAKLTTHLNPGEDAEGSEIE
jgi:anti-sigma factor RsiW